MCVMSSIVVMLLCYHVGYGIISEWGLNVCKQKLRIRVKK